ncbi:MAG: TonB-dependent receptor plug domain-containing protein [Rhodospirillaceae bacterium]|nr:TonB-dependent receptor plug domain-containing protein [Rhodospirillales bacterium]
MGYRFPAALMASLLPAVAMAQTATTLPPVTVDVAAPDDTALLSGTVLNEGDLAAKRSATSDTARLLKDVPGVSLYTGGGVSSLPVIHGMADDRIKMLVDGMPITAACPNHMNPALSYVDSNDVAKIDVLAGITPVSAGGDSIAGTINVDSAKPAFAAPGEDIHTEGRLSTAYRSTSHGITTSGNVSASTENFSLGYAGSWAHAGDYHRGGDNAPVRTSQYQTENHALTVGAQNADNLVIVEGGWQFIPYEGFPNQRMDLTENTSKFVNARHEGQFGWGKLDSRAYWRNTTHEMNFLGKVKGNDMPMNTESTDLGYSIKGELPLSARDTLRVGNEFHHFALEDWWPPVAGTGMSPYEFQNIRDGRRDRLGTFAEWEAKWTSQWTSLLGVRNDTVWMDAGDVQGYRATYAADAARFNSQDHSKTDVNLDLTALARFEADKASTYEAGYARKTRSPNLHERYTWSTGAMALSMNNWVGDGNGYVGSINLKPEVAHTLSTSADWHDPARKTWGLKVTPYYTYVQDYIDADRRPNQTTGAGFVNLQLANHDAQLYGADISGDLEAWDAPGWGRGVLKATVGWVNGQNLDTGDNLYNIMPLHARLALEHRLGGWSNAIETEGAVSKDAVSHTRNEIQTPGYALIHLRTGYDWQNVSANLGVENLFNQLYHEPLGGADLSDTGRQWGMNVPGAGRTYLAGVTVRF